MPWALSPAMPSSMPSWEDLHGLLRHGQPIPKPAQPDQFVGWTWKDGLRYEMPSEGRSRKTIVRREWDYAVQALARSGEFTRDDYKRAFPRIYATSPCNFTTIGGLLTQFCSAAYDGNGRYIHGH